MATQDSRLSIVIDSRQAESRLDKLRKLFLGVDKSTADAARGVDKLSDELGSFSGSTNKAASSLGGLGKGFSNARTDADKLNLATQKLGFTLNSLKGLMGGVFAGIGIASIAQTADAMQNLDSQVRLVTNGVEEFNTIQERLREIANAQYSDIGSLTELYTNSRRALEQLGKTQENTLQFTNNLAMAMRVGGGEAQAQAAALTQLGQALASGVLRGDEFNSIAEQAPILLRLVSEEMGVTQGKLRSLAADGKITSEIVYNAVANATESLEEMASKMPTTISQALTVVKNNYQTFVGDLLNSSTGITSAIAGAIGVVANNFQSLATVAAGGAAVWGAYTLTTSAFVTTTIPAMISGITAATASIIAQSAAIQASIASAFSLSAMQDLLTASTYRLQQARVEASLALLNYKLALYEAVAAMRAKAASVAGAIAVQAQYAAGVLTSGNVTAILAAQAGLAASSFKAKALSIVATTKANAIYLASIVATRGVVGATVLGVTTLAKSIVAKTAAMVAATRQTSVYTLAMKGLGGAARLAGTGVIAATGSVARLGAVLMAHPILTIAGTLFTVIAATEGLDAAMSSLSDAIRVVGLMFSDFVHLAVGWIKNLATAFNSWISGFIKNSEKGVNESSGMFAWMFDTTAGGFVGLLQVVANVFDGAVKVIGTFAMTVGKGVYNLAVSIKNNAAGMGNSLIEAFNAAGRVIANILNGIARQANKVISGLNNLPMVNIPTMRDDIRIEVGHRFNTSTVQLDNSIQGNWNTVSSVVDQNGARQYLDSVIGRMQEGKKASAALTESIAGIGNAADGAGDKADKAGKKGKKAAKGTKKELTDAEKAALKLAEAFDKAKASLEKSIAMVGKETAFDEWLYDLYDINNELFELGEAAKKTLLGLAVKLDFTKFKDDIANSNTELLRQQEILEANTELEREELRLQHEATDLLSKYQSIKDNGLKAQYEEIEGHIRENLQLKIKIKHLEAIKAVNDEIKQSTEDIRKELFLFGNDSPLDALNYDLEFTKKYANASEQAIRELHDAMYALEQKKAGAAFEDLLGSQASSDNPMVGIMQEYQDKLEVIRNYENLHRDLLAESLEERLRVEKAYHDARREMMFASGETISGGMASIFKGMLGEQSKAYKLMFAIEKGFVVALAALKVKEAMARAMGASDPYTRAIAVGEAVAQGSKIVEAIRQVVMPVGQAHDGIMSVPKSGTWNLEKGERVLPQHTAKALDKKLADGDGKKIIINNYSGEKAEVSKDAQGNDIITIGKMINQVVDQKISKWERNAQRQGGVLAR